MRTNAQSTTSQLPRVLLQVNPGLTRRLSTELAIMDKLRSDLMERFSEKEKLLEKLNENQRALKKQVDEARKEGMKEAEERLGSELRQSLRQQQDQWEVMVGNTRAEAEQSRKQLVDHWESQVDLLEQKLRKVEAEKLEGLSKERQLTSLTEQFC